MNESVVHITDTVSILMPELQFRFARSSGPGGQHVNRSATQVELLFDVANSPSLTDAQRVRVLVRLSGHIDSAGVLHLFSQSARSQLRNRHEVVDRFQALIRHALKRRRRRKPTRPSAASRERRLQEKRERGQRKRLRGQVREPD